MRTWLMMTLVVVALVVGCAMQDKHRPYFHDEGKYPDAFSATYMGQDFDERSVVDFLSPAEREALRKTDWQMASEHADEFDQSSTGLGAPPSTGDKVAGTTMSVIGMGIALGAMAAPFLLY